MDNYLKNELYKLIRRDETIFDFIQEEALRGFCYLDLEKNYFWMNPKLKMVLGYVSGNTLEGFTWKDFIHPEDFIQLKQSLQETHFSRQVFDHDLQFLHQEGYFIRLQGKYRVFFSDSNTPHRLLIAHAEISMGSRSAATKNVFEDFFERSGELLSIATPEGRFVKINQAWEKTLGYTIEDLNYSKFLDLIHPDDMEATLKAIREVTEGKEIRDFINRYRHKDGSYRHIEWQSIIRGDLIYSVSRDISEKLAVAQELKNNEEMLRNLANSLPGLIMRYQLFPNAEDRITFISQGIEAVYELTVEQALKDVRQVWAKVIPEDIPALQASILASAQTLTFWHHEWRSRMSDGSIKYILGQGTPKLMDDGSILWNTLLLDITQEKIIKQQLIASQERFQAMVEHSKDIFILTHPHQLIYVSPNIKEILGYTPEEFAQMNPEDIIHADDLPLRWSELQAPGSFLSLEYRILHKNGQWLYIEAFGKNLHHLEHINAMVFNLRDISERKEYEQEIMQKNRDLAASEEELRISEEELKANIEELLVSQAELQSQKLALELSEEKYRKVVENQTDFVLLSFPDTTISFANQPLAEAMGVSLSEIIGKKWIDFTIPEDLNFIENKIALLTPDDDFFIWENRDQRAGGQWGWTQWVNQGFFDASGKLLQIQSVGRDITELKRIQEALSTSESEARALARRYKSILDSQAVYVIKTDLQGFYTFVNDYFKEKFGYLGDFIGTNALDTIIEADRDACRDTVAKCFVQPDLPHEVILRKIDKDGVIKGAKWEFKGVLDESGQVSEILCVGFDISEQLESLDRLKHLLDVTSDQNNRLQNFAHIISHNIRSHSANLTSLVNFMQEAESEEEKEMYFQMLVQSTAKLDDTITNLNEIISIHQAFNKPKEKLPLRQQIVKTLEVLTGLALQKNIQIYNEVPEEIYIRAIPAYLDSILLNVLSNAVKYSDPSKPESFIRIITYKTGEFLVVSIQDNGLGFDSKKNAHKIFGMYKTFHKNEDARGLGLFITKNQIEAMGGKIEVESEIAIGSTFNIFFHENS